MPWKESSVMNLRIEFVDLAKNGGNISRLCKHFGISRKTGYKWLERFQSSGQTGLENLSRRPVHSPGRISRGIEEAIIHVREKHHAWGGRKIRRFLQNSGVSNVPAASTITEVLRRNGLIHESDASKHSPFQRFERKYLTSFGKWILKDMFLVRKVVVIH